MGLGVCKIHALKNLNDFKGNEEMSGECARELRISLRREFKAKVYAYEGLVKNGIILEA